MNPAATLLLLGMVLGSGSSWAQDAPAVPQAVTEQATVTTFAVRAERARILADAREGWWSGDLPLVEGYPQASSRDWMSPTVLRGRLLVLDVRAQQRASEALAATDQEALGAAMQAAHREEERNDSLERRLWSALLARHAERPDLAAVFTSAAWQSASNKAGQTAGPDASAEVQAQVASEARVAADGLARTEALVGELLFAPIEGREVVWQPDSPTQEADAALRLERWRMLAVEQPSEALTGWLAEADAPAVDSQQDAEEVAAERAVEAAEEALADARDAQERRAAALLAGGAEARRRATESRLKADEIRQSVEAVRASTEGQLAELTVDVEGIRRRSFGQDGPDADEVYRAVRSLSQRLRADPATGSAPILEARAEVEQVRERTAEESRRLRDARSWLETLDSSEDKTRLTEVLDTWQADLKLELDYAIARSEAASMARELVLEGLLDTRELRRDLRPFVSSAESSSDQQYLLEDAGQELGLLYPTLALRAQDRTDELAALPEQATNYNLLRRAFVSILWATVFLTLWLWARGQAQGWGRRLADRVHELRPEYRPSDVAALVDPTSRFLRAFVDLVLGWLLVERLGQFAPELGLLLLAYLQVALFRAVLAGFDLAVVPPEEVRPALLILRSDPRALLRRTVRWFVGLWIAKAFLYELMWHIMGLDVVAELVSWLFSLSLVAVAAWALHRGEPHLRRRIQRRNQEFVVVSTLSSEPRHSAERIPRALAILTFFMLVAAVDLIYVLGRHQAGVAWLVAAVNRLRGADVVHDDAALSAEERDRIEADDAVPVWRLDRDEVRVQVLEAYDVWTREQRRGMVALVGDRGSGKRTTMRQLIGALEERGQRHVHAYLGDVLVDERDALVWLAGVAGVPEPKDAESLVFALAELPPTVFLIRGFDRAWSRQVGGFEAMTTLLYVLNSSCSRHFFVTGFHRLGWRFLASTGSLVDMGVFRTVVALEVLSAGELKALTLARTKRAGFSVDFGSLVRPSAFGGDPALEEERAANLFYRVLAEASGGSARVALGLWTRCLVHTEKRDHLSVVLATELDGGHLTDLVDPALFVLMALRIQDALSEAEIEAVTNLPRPLLRTTVRDLLSRGLVELHQERLRVPDPWLPSVTRVLRRRHLLHLGGV